MVASIEGEEFEVTAEEFGSHEDAGDLGGGGECGGHRNKGPR